MHGDPSYERGLKEKQRHGYKKALWVIYAPNDLFLIFFGLEIAEVLMNEGNDEFKKRDFRNAVHLYTEGIKVRCKDGELKAKLYSNRSAACFKLGENI